MKTACPSLIRETISAYIKAFDELDLDAICDLYTDSATVEDPVGTPKKVGKEEIRRFYEMAIATKAQLTMLAEPLVVGNFSATPIKAVVDRDAGVLVLEFISVMSYNGGGKITSMAALFDPADIEA